MSLLVALGFLIAGVCPGILCHSDGILGTDTMVHEVQDNGTQVRSLKFADTSADFAFSLYKQLALKYPDQNVVFSPLSISIALALLSLGSNSNTLTEILEGLRFNLKETTEAAIHQDFGDLLHMLSQPRKQVQISTGTAMFIEKDLKILAEFQEKAKAIYQAEAFTTDFQQPLEAKELINDYLNNKTQGKIKELISELDQTASLLLMNYILFKGNWKNPFNPYHTFMDDFYLDKGGHVTVASMDKEDITIPYFRDDKLSCSMVELKYTGNASALFILPDEYKMQQLEANLNTATLRRWKDSVRPRMVDGLYLPRFSIFKEYSLEDVLPQLGIREVFSPQANLSGITETKDLRLSRVVHKAQLDVGEKGTELATTLTRRIDFVTPKVHPLIIHFNRPYIIIISDKSTQTDFLIAKVNNPKQN